MTEADRVAQALCGTKRGWLSRFAILMGVTVDAAYKWRSRKQGNLPDHIYDRAGKILERRKKQNL